MRKINYLWVICIALAMPIVAQGQPIVAFFDYYIFNGDEPALTDGCDGGTPFGDGHPVSIYYDPNNNGPDGEDNLMEIGSGLNQSNINSFVFNGEIYELGAGYFLGESVRIVTPLEENRYYYLKVSGENTCWYTSTKTLNPGPQSVNLFADDWFCMPSSCAAGGVPAAPTNVQASDGTACLGLNVTWEHDLMNVAGFTVWINDVYKGFFEQPILEAYVVELAADIAHTVEVQAVGGSHTVASETDEGYMIVRRFAVGETGDMEVLNPAGAERSLELDIPGIGDCSSFLTLDLLVNDQFHSNLANYDNPDSADVRNVHFMLPNDTLQNCRIVMNGYSLEYPQVTFTDTTVTYFSVGQIISADEPHTGVPATFELLNAYPNPFNVTVNIPFEVSRTAELKLEVINTLGQTVKVLANGVHTVGSHTMSWNGQNASGTSVSSGIYFYRLEASDLVQTKKLIYLR